MNDFVVVVLGLVALTFAITLPAGDDQSKWRDAPGRAIEIGPQPGR